MDTESVFEVATRTGISPPTIFRKMVLPARARVLLAIDAAQVDVHVSPLPALIRLTDVRHHKQQTSQAGWQGEPDH
jgi:hypothetical protein